VTHQATETVLCAAPSVHTVTAGLGPDARRVLLLHGIGGSSGSFERQLAAFGAVRHVIAWDAPGYAQSPDPTSAPGVAGYAAAAAGLLQGGAPADVVGVSWGGVIATRLALAYPELVRTLTLADSSRGSGRTPEGREAMRLRSAALTAQGPEAFAAERGPRLLGPAAPATLVDRVVGGMARSIRQPGYGYAAASMGEADHSRALAGLLVPTLVIVGEHDAVTGVTESRALAEGIPGARLVVLPGAGHAANQEQPDAFNRAVLDFWASAC
jgi:pimeloyl-ACP methyl ester carboxylesterase